MITIYVWSLNLRMKKKKTKYIEWNVDFKRKSLNL